MSGCKYITISYNILSDKRLNSTDKLVYGIIESACRMYDSCCTMSNDTIAKILNTTTRTIQSSISKLVKYKFIYRKIENANESYIKLRSMTVIQDTDTTKNTSYLHEENFTPPMKKTSHKYNNKNNNKYIVEIKEIIDYLNLRARKNFRSLTAATQSLIKARLNEGFTVEDFKKVIDIKCSEWLGSDYAQYLRPQTLFGTKFESYLNSIDTVKPKKDFDILSTYETL